MASATINLYNDQIFPLLGLGTWQSAPGEVEEAVKYAIDVGYRHIDCAMLYGNETEIGTAIRAKIADGTVTRDELFIVSKLWNTFHEKELVVPACKKSLDNFGLDYLDLYLIHWPVSQKTVGTLNVSFPFNNAFGTNYDYVDTWIGMEECFRLGLTKGIGVSNFNSKQIERLLETAVIRPVMNQIEVHPNLNQKKLIEFCKDRNIAITAYSPFGSPTRPWAKPGDPILSFDDHKIVQIAKKYKKTSNQVILRYLIDIGTAPIPKSANKQRIKENIDIFDFALTPEEIMVMDTFECNGRVCTAEELKKFPYYPFDIEF